jgi:hypothetical protein
LRTLQLSVGWLITIGNIGQEFQSDINSNEKHSDRSDCTCSFRFL